MLSPADILDARILVVDDSTVNALLLERMLAAAGYRSITTTNDPRAVRELHRTNQYDLILLDLLMPGMDGFEVMNGLKDVETEGYLPVLVVTAQPGHKLRALQAGAKDFIAKPFDHVEVLTRIHNMLEVRLLLRESRSYGRLLEQYDQLTGLPNRTRYRELLAQALERCAGDETVSVLFVAVDQLNAVTDALGRVTGGALLRRVGDRLVRSVGPTDTVARFDGDEFGLIVVTAGTGAHGAQLMANAVRDALRAPVDLDGHEVVVTASIGIAVSPTDSRDMNTLMKGADAALREARSAGDTFRFYSTEMNARAFEALELENALRCAHERGEFVLHYQPKMRIATGEWSGVEALLRWDRPGHGLVMPADFIAILEETGMIIPVGRWVIQTACRQISEWARAGIGPIRVAVNVSGKQFMHGGFVADVARAIEESGIPPETLDIEITESSLMSRREDIDNVLGKLKAMGVWLAIDDFGTGYSSLAYLKRFPIGTLKIDISFIRDVTTDPDGAAITVAIIHMARSLKMRVIAEGVETQPQLDFLREHACDEIQGYLCSPPLPASELAKLHEESHSAALAV